MSYADCHDTRACPPVNDWAAGAGAPSACDRPALVGRDRLDGEPDQALLGDAVDGRELAAHGEVVLLPGRDQAAWLWPV